MCVVDHMDLQACMSGQDYFQFSYWLEPSTLPQMLAHRPPQPSPASLASHLSLAASLCGWPAGVENQPLMGLWGLEEGTAGVVERMKAPGGAACTD